MKKLHGAFAGLFTMILISTNQASLPSGMITTGSQGLYDPLLTEELRVRDGLPNAFAKLNAGEEVRVAYVGGSITDAEGWRGKTFAELKEQYPKANLIQVEAAVPGTGADFAACRLADDVLVHKPDLVFVEFRVNLGGGFEARAIEGLVRQLWEANPETDICLVYTIGKWMIDDISSGKQHFFGKIMETMANEYGIPSIDLGVEVMKQMKNDELVFQTDKPVEGKLWFSKDGVHPIDAGHELYATIVLRSFQTMKEYGSPAPHKLPTPLEKDHFANASLIPASAFKTSKHWKPVDVETDEIYNRDANRTADMLRGAVKATKVGETLEFDWEGKLICFTHIPQGNGMEIEVSLDGGASKTYTLDQESNKNIFARFQYAMEQEPGKHSAKLTVTKLPEGQTFYAGQILVIDEPE